MCNESRRYGSQIKTTFPEPEINVDLIDREPRKASVLKDRPLERIVLTTIDTDTADIT